MARGDGRALRCAIYTRKSTEEGLEQEFNSLDAQRVACLAYIQSQVHEGWALVPEHYDDGGFSGGNMDRPALRNLLADVKAGKVDVIVVYKVDRLTRSLADFARIVDVLDKHSASFVSVTQAFNTTSSMGRLTLNVLLSFAQFEREVTSERIRDKVAASKARGMWMGGNIPVGYDVIERKLIVNERQAELVRRIFSRYLALGSVVALAQELEREGVRSPIRVSRAGRTSGGAVLSNGALATILRNRVYVGEISNKGKAYKGEHRGIIDPALFAQVQELLATNRANTIAGLNADHPSLLAGLVWDHHGRRMVPDHAAKKGRRYRYYASKTAKDDGSRTLRVPAGDLEAIVVAHLSARGLLPDNSNLSRADLTTKVQRIAVSPTELRIYFSHSAGGDADVAIIPVQLARRGKETRLAQPPHASVIGRRDPALIKLVVRASIVRAAIEAEGDLSVQELAEAHGYSPDYFRVLLRISYLAPDITAGILEGRQPAGLNRQRLARCTNLPGDWSEQRIMLGF